MANSDTTIPERTWEARIHIKPIRFLASRAECEAWMGRISPVRREAFVINENGERQLVGYVDYIEAKALP